MPLPLPSTAARAASTATPAKCWGSSGLHCSASVVTLTCLGTRRSCCSNGRFTSGSDCAGASPLRLEAAYWWRHSLEALPPPGWCLGRFDLVGPRRPVQLLKERVIDALIDADPDLPDHDPELVVLRFSDAAIQLIADPRHPLQHQTGLQLDDTSAFPTLALPDALFPEAARAFRSLGLWRTPVRMARYDCDRWEGLCEDAVTIGYGFGLSLEVLPALRPLPLAVPMRTSDALILRRDVAEQLQFSLLLGDLRSRVIHHAVGHLDYQVIDSLV